MSVDAQQRLRTQLQELGFDEVRFAAVNERAGAVEDPKRGLRGWIEQGMQADMHWLDRTVDKRLEPSLVLPGARSVIMLGVSYWSSRLASFGAVPAPRWARYALYDDYHDTMKPALAAAGRLLEVQFGAGAGDYRYYVDTGPVIERGWAAESGLGFVGKNAMLISRRHGNWLFLAAILTRLELAPDKPIRRAGNGPAAGADARGDGHGRRTGADSGISKEPPVGVLCGKCTRCLDACPTNAFAQPGVVDARRCISYQTIENKGVIPRELRAGVGDRIYGCDICLEVCPWNRFARDGRQMLLAARHELAALKLRDILALTPERFAEVFRRTPIKRVKLVGLLRNACVVAGNLRDPSLLPPLIDLASRHASALVRAHAVWAVCQLGGASQLREARDHETDPAVLAEYAAEASTD